MRPRSSPESTFWFGLPAEVDRTLYTVDDYRLAGVERTDDEPRESDLFAGLRSNVTA